jgi:LysR family transcriptional regulator, chromosome initiation inhibitor
LHRPHLHGLQELVPGAWVDVMLYWQHWTREAPSAQRLTQAVKAAAHNSLKRWSMDGTAVDAPLA